MQKTIFKIYKMKSKKNAEKTVSSNKFSFDKLTVFKFKNLTSVKGGYVNQDPVTTTQVDNGSSRRCEGN